MDWAELMIYKLDSFDVSSNSFGPIACRDSNNDFRRMQEQEEDSCPFLLPPVEGFSPCYICEFPLGDNVTEDCALSINIHCLFTFQSGEKVEEAACLEHMDLVLGVQCDYGGVDEELIQALSFGITEGRDGKGVIYVFAAGNEYTEGEDASQQSAVQNTRYTISVGAVGQDRTHAYYSTQGTAVFISAPGGSTTLNSVQLAAANVGGIDVCTDSRSGKQMSVFLLHSMYVQLFT